MKITFYDVKRVNATCLQQLVDTAKNVLSSGEFILGKELVAFENEFASFCGAKFCAGVGNGLDALFLSLKALDIGTGDEVIVPAHTFIATWFAGSRTGATPVPVDVRYETCNINPDLIQQAITKKTKAIIPVHLYGQVCEMDAIMKIAQENNLHVVEDFAQAQGALYRGNPAGTFGIVNATSFYPSKNLGAFGDAGAVTTADENLHRKIKMLSNYGSNEKYIHELIGYNSRLDNLQAALLRIKLAHIKKENERRRQFAAHYKKNLAGVGDLIFQQEAEGAESIYHLFVIRTSKRNELAAHLKRMEIETMIHYPVPPFKQKAYSQLGLAVGKYPVANSIAETCLSLPMFGDLTTEEVNYVVEKIRSFFG